MKPNILNYFKIIPKTQTSNVNEITPTNNESTVNQIVVKEKELTENETKNSEFSVKSDEKESETIQNIDKENINIDGDLFYSKKYKRIRIDDDEDDIINNNNKVPWTPASKKMKIFKDENQISPVKPTEKDNFFEIQTESTPKKIKSITKGKKINASTKALLSSFSSTVNESMSELNTSQYVDNANLDEVHNFDHLNLEFLKKENIRDIQKRKYDHPDYDASSLFLPESFTSKLTPAMKQWWKIKSNGNMQTILFFKVGKFYETYHMDAVTAVQELGLTFMKGNFAHSGFPEIAFAKMADQLVLKGHNVARVEQTETVEAMNERVRNEGSKNKVVKREICQIITPGTRGFSIRNRVCREMGQEGSEELGYIGDSGGLLYAFKETIIGDIKPKSRYTANIGIALVNTNTGKFTISQFTDDDQRSRLRTMISRFPPNEIIYLRGNLSKYSQNVFNTCLAATKKECLMNNKQFLNSTDTLARLLESGYFAETPSYKLSQFGLPIGLKNALSESDNLGRTASVHYELAVSCIGALIHYLGKCLIDRYLISIADFNIYTPIDGCESTLVATSCQPFYDNQMNMILDSSTLTNLDILTNSTVGGTEGTLLERLDFSSTAFGRRLLIQWIATPLCNPQMIMERQEGINELMDADGKLSSIKSYLKSLPDLEKLITQIHVLGMNKSVAEHPDSRAVLYENLTYSKRKINDFVTTLIGFDNIIKIQKNFAELNTEQNFKSQFLKKIMLCSSDDESGEFPEIQSIIEFFLNSFDQEKAQKDGKIIPEKGVDNDLDETTAQLQEVERDLSVYLENQKTIMRCDISYFGTGRNRYQLEIPENDCSRISDEYVVSGQRKGYKRYTTSVTEKLLANMILAEEKRDVALKNIMGRIFSKFDENYLQWTQVISSIAQFDALLALAKFSRGIDGGPMTKPEIRPINPNTKPYLVITEGRYPCKAKTQTGEFISNTIKLGSFLTNSEPNTDNSVMLLTGPNMGGKSTLMKQTALIIILSQLGCYVPADGPVILTPVDRLFTRQGANDSIGSGQSTLQVEMNETALILSYMTENSFLLIDELGRGTATYDGCALAYSILKRISDNLAPRTIFSTHFHKLLEEKDVTAKIQISHMACMVEDEENSVLDNELKLQNITFLYKLTDGGCPKSYGFNAARLANIPETIILNGLNKAHLFEEETLISEFKKCLKDKNLTREKFKMWQLRFRKIYNKCH